MVWAVRPEEKEKRGRRVGETTLNEKIRNRGHALGVALLLCAMNPVDARVTQDFNFGWRFQGSDTPDAQVTSFEDGSWREVRLPHDWSIEAPFTREQAGGAGAFLPGGIGWYRKTFTIPAEARERVTRIEFDGVYNNAEVWINGRSLGFQPYGYTPFAYDLTDFLNYGGTNVIAVRVDRSAFLDCRWYPGSGIYRPVKLVSCAPLHIPQWGVYVTTPSVSAAEAEISVEITVTHAAAAASPRASTVGPHRIGSGSDSKSDLRPAASVARDVELITEMIGPSGAVIASVASSLSLEPGQSTTAKHTARIAAPRLWSPDAPALYRVVSRLRKDGHDLDSVETPFGIRSIRYDPDQGFFLNGRHTLLKGVCLHHAAGCVGAAVPDGVWVRRLEKLKAMGCNAIRTAHNPPSEAFLDLCDRMGFLVQDEAFDEWNYPKDKRHNYKEQKAETVTRGYTDHFEAWSEADVKAMVLRDRNHPSVIMWSIGNEIEWTYAGYGDATGYWTKESSADYYWDLPPYDEAKRKEVFAEKSRTEYNLAETAKRLADPIRELDRTRPVTANLVIPTVSGFSGFMDALDVVGYSYRRAVYDYCHEKYPGKCMIGTENWGQWEEWKAVLDRPYLAGIFVWTGINYMGESRRWPTRGSGSGFLDFAGFEKPNYHFYKTLWSEEKSVHLVTQVMAGSNYHVEKDSDDVVERPDRRRTRQWGWPRLNRHWNYDKGEEIYAEVYTNCDEVELLLNGRSLGRRALADAPDRLLKWRVPFEEGELKAVAVGAEDRLESAGPPHRILLESGSSSLTADRYDVAHVVARLVDRAGRPVRHDEREIRFSVDGPAQNIGVDNGSTTISGDLQSDRCRTNRGRCLLVVRAGDRAGAVTVEASAEGLEPGRLELRQSLAPSRQ